jgi:hypothetical protein
MKTGQVVLFVFLVHEIVIYVTRLVIYGRAGICGTSDVRNESP